MKWKVLLALASAALPMAANALGLGEIKLNSALNDRFNADIPVVGATSDELDSLEVKLAGMSQFTQAGLDRPDVLNQLQFVVVRNPDGTSFVHITSNAAVREPFLDFLVDASWNNGELIREYTVLLNPPAFQTANAAPAAAAPAPAAQVPAASTAAPVAVVPVPVPAPSATTQPAAAPTPTETPAAQAPAEVAAAPQPAPNAASTAAPAAPPPAAPAPSVEQAPAQRALGTNYGPIRRGETLSSIAKSVRPEGVTLNQMMIAIYQANPEVFMHNINRMKSGYIMRMPTASDAQAVSVTDANTEVRDQMQAWRSGHIEAAPSAGTAAAPALQLVAPGSSESTTNTQTPGAETNGTGETPAAPAPVVPAANPEPTKSSSLPPPAPAAQPANQAPLSVQSNAAANVQAQAAKQNANPAPTLPPPAATNVPLSNPKPEPKQFTQPESGGGIMDLLFPYGFIVLLLILAVVAGVVVIKKRKAKGGSGATSSGGRIKADWMKQESVDSGDNTAASSTTRTKGKFKKSVPAEEQDRTVMSEPPTELAGGGDSDKTMLMAAPPPAPMQETVVSGGGGSQLDVSDPMAEADFHMAYGLYDQAADVLKKALRQNPDSRPLQVKLLEVFFTAGDRTNFVNEARKLRQSMGASPDKDWESVAIMGRQVAPDEALFSASGASMGTGAVDIALDGGGTDTVVSDLDALEGAFTSAGATPAPVAPAPAPAPVDDNSLEFSLPDLEPMASPDAPAEAPAAAPAASGDFDLGDLNFEPTPSAKPAEKKAEPTLGTDEPTMATDFGTDSQVEFDKALNDLASFVNTNVPAQPEISAQPEGADKTLAIRPPKPAPELSMDAPADDAGGGSSMNEIGTKLDLARAYIDMGDPDGAKSILEEVVAEGNAQQKSEAQELLKHVS